MLLSVVIPCFNEKESVRRYPSELLPELERLGVPYEVVAVDDGSSDGTVDALKALPGSAVVRHETNRGLGAALRTGFAAARGEWIATLDADLTFHPRQLALLLAEQKESGADLVAGSPFLKGGGCPGVSWARRLPSLCVNAFYRGLFSPSLTAYTPILRLYRAEVLKALPLISEGFEINAEIAARFVKAGRKTAEVPAVLTSRREGESKLRALRELSRHARLVARLLLW